MTVYISLSYPVIYQSHKTRWINQNERHTQKTEIHSVPFGEFLPHCYEVVAMPVATSSSMWVQNKVRKVSILSSNTLIHQPLVQRRKVEWEYLQDDRRLKGRYWHEHETVLQTPQKLPFFLANYKKHTIRAHPFKVSKLIYSHSIYVIITNIYIYLFTLKILLFIFNFICEK